MASLSVAAIVVSHAQADSLKRVLLALKEQSHPISQVVVVETASDEASIEAAKSLGYSVISAGNIRLGAAINSGLAALQEQPGWLWILHDDSFPEPDALALMSIAAEISPSVAVIGPKLLEAANPIRIQQLGLTVTRSGRPFLQVANEYDQGQHDGAGDAFAVSTAAMLISSQAWKQIGGLNDLTPPLAQDLELGAKVRAAGYRVVVEPKARVLHSGLSAAGGRPKKWLGGTFTQGISKAHIHMATLLYPLPVLILLYLGLPILAVLGVPLMLLTKRPNRIIGQFKAWFWAWATIPRRFAARAALRSLGSLKPLKTLKANYSAVRKRRKSRLFEEPMRDPNAPKGIFASNSGWLALFTMAASSGLFPNGALVSDNWLPLGRTFRSVFESTGTFVAGTDLPSDPFGYFLTAIAAMSPANPSLGLSWFIFLSPTIAFFGGWQLLSNFVSKIWVRNFGAMLFAGAFVLPAAMQVWVVETTSMALLPWAIHFVIRSSRAFSPARSWRWMGLSALAIAAVSIATPILFPVLAVILLAVSFRRLSRLAIGIWSLIPAGVILWPWGVWAVAQDPWLLSISSAGSTRATLTDPSNPMFFGFYLIVLLSVLGAMVGDLRKTWALALGGALVFTAAQFQPYASSFPVLALSALLLLILGGISLEAISKKFVNRSLAWFLILTSLAPLVWFGFVSASSASFQEPRAMPALVVAAADVDPEVLTLKIKPGDPIEAQLVRGDGISQDELSFARMVSPVPYANAEKLSLLVGTLVAGNSNGVTDLLRETGVSFVLLDMSDPTASQKIATGLNSMIELQPAGDTQFGSLWKSSEEIVNKPSGLRADPYRNVALWIIFGFCLLAIPTPATIRGYRKIETGEI